MKPRSSTSSSGEEDEDEDEEAAELGEQRFLEDGVRGADIRLEERHVTRVVATEQVVVATPVDEHVHVLSRRSCVCGADPPQSSPTSAADEWALCGSPEKVDGGETTRATPRAQSHTHTCLICFFVFYSFASVRKNERARKARFVFHARLLSREKELLVRVCVRVFSFRARRGERERERESVARARTSREGRRLSSFL